MTEEKCPFCGGKAPALAARGSRVRRKCRKGHRFWSGGHVGEGRLAVIEQRNRAVVRRVLANKGRVTLGQVAAEFGLTCHSQVSRIMDRYAPKFKTYVSGQRARRRRERRELRKRLGQKAAAA